MAACPPAAPSVLPPTPTLDNDERPSGLDPAALLPLDSPPVSPPALAPQRSAPPASLNASFTSSATVRRGSSGGPAATPNPFNFQPMMAVKAVPAPGGARPNQRRGHKYKHSSVSHQIFLEPPVRAPLALPASLPIPTLTELYRSISHDQRTRSLWCLCHLCVAGFTLYSSQGSLALTALSHLILFDALGASLCVAVDVLSNFEVWKRNTVRHPFGLERAEVLAGFAMSVFLLFMGFDIISHTAEHLVEGFYSDDGHGHAGSHEEHLLHARVSPGSVDLAALFALFSTLTSAVLLGNHARIGRAMRFAYLSSLPSLLSNPSHLLTIICSVVLLLIPLLSLPLSAWLDRALALSIAVSMIFIGVRLVKVLGSMLLMSYGGRGVQDAVHEIQSHQKVSEVLEARVWEVHHGLCMAIIKLVVQGERGPEADTALRKWVQRIVRERLEGYYGSGRVAGRRWEISVALT